MNANFDSNSMFMYVIVAVVIAFVIVQSIVFLLKAWRRGKAIGLSTAVMRKTVVTSAVFTIAPAVAILLGVIALSKALGFPLPWLRLSVIGALTYETTAAASTLKTLGYELKDRITDPALFSAVAWVMTLGIIPGLVLPPIIGKKLESGLIKLKNKDARWGDIFMAGLFLGMISAFLGMIFADVRKGLVGWIPVFVMLAAAVLMMLCGLVRKLLNAKWIEDYALPISMLGGMALAIPITNLVTAIAGAA